MEILAVEFKRTVPVSILLLIQTLETIMKLLNQETLSILSMEDILSILSDYQLKLIPQDGNSQGKTLIGSTGLSLIILIWKAWLEKTMLVNGHLRLEMKLNIMKDLLGMQR